MAAPVKPQSRRSRTQPAIFANPVETDAPAFAPLDPAPAMTAAIDAAPVSLVIPSVAAYSAVVPEPASTPVAAEIAAPTDLPERTVETVAAPLETTVSTVWKGPNLATTFETMKPQDMMGDITTRAKGVMEKGAKFAEDMTEFTKGNVEAIVTSGRVAAKGVESMAHEAAETAKANFEQAQTAMKSFAQVKSPTELFQLQSDYAKSAFDQLVANASKTSEQMMKLMGDIAQPLSNRYAIASEKVKSAAL